MNAFKKYQQHQQTIDTLIEKLRIKLDDHAKRAEASPNNWGFTEELGHLVCKFASINEQF